MRSGNPIARRSTRVELVDVSSGRHYIRAIPRRPGSPFATRSLPPVLRSSADPAAALSSVSMFLGLLMLIAGTCGLLAVLLWKEEIFLPLLLGLGCAAVAIAGVCKLGVEDGGAHQATPQPRRP
jgi:hypothetical protein